MRCKHCGRQMERRYSPYRDLRGKIVQLWHWECDHCVRAGRVKRRTKLDIWIDNYWEIWLACLLVVVPGLPILGLLAFDMARKGEAYNIGGFLLLGLMGMVIAALVLAALFYAFGWVMGWLFEIFFPK